MSHFERISEITPRFPRYKNGINRCLPFCHTCRNFQQLEESGKVGRMKEVESFTGREIEKRMDVRSILL